MPEHRPDEVYEPATAILYGPDWKAVHFDPHERWTALLRYSDMLTAEQREKIKKAPDDAVIRIETERGGITSVIAITPYIMREMRGQAR